MSKNLDRILAGEDVRCVLSEGDKLDLDSIKKAVKDAATDIHGDPDMDIIDDMIANAIDKLGDDSEEEDIVQAVIGMMRSGS